MIVRAARWTIVAIVLPPVTLVWAASAIGEAALEHARALRDIRREVPRLRRRVDQLEQHLAILEAEREAEEDEGFYRDLGNLGHA